MALSFADLKPPVGRGERTMLSVGDGEALLIDESYNANPASMRAALANLGAVELGRGARRIAVLGDMKELGETGPRLHAELAEAIEANRIDLVFAAGPLMQNLVDALPKAQGRSPCADIRRTDRRGLRRDPSRRRRHGQGLAQHEDGPDRQGLERTLRREPGGPRAERMIDVNLVG